MPTIHKPKKNIATFKAPADNTLGCYIADDIFEKGLGSMMLTQQQPNGLINITALLLDPYCTGIRELMLFDNVDNITARMLIEQISGEETLKPFSPCCAKKLLTQITAYAKTNGFNPSKDYKTLQNRLKLIDDTQCEAQFCFGLDGQPFYVPNGLLSKNKVLADIQKLAKHRPNGDYGIDAEYFEHLFGVPLPLTDDIVKH